jgi:hypothetical protein
MTDYSERVLENVKMLANIDFPGEWVDPATGKKLYNEAYVADAQREAEIVNISALKNYMVGGSATFVDWVNYLTERLASLQDKEQS